MSLRLIICYFSYSLFLLGGIVEAQVKKDSLLKVINSNEADTNRIFAMATLMAECNKEEIDQAYEYMFQAEKIAEKLPKRKDVWLGHIYRHMAYFKVDKMKDYAGGMNYIKQAIEHFDRGRDYVALSYAYAYLAREIFERMEMIDEAIDYLKKSIYTRINDPNFNIDYSYYIIGWLETTNDRLDSGQAHLTKAYRHALRMKGYGFLPELLIWLGNNQSFRKNYVEAKPYFLRAIQLADSVNNDFSASEGHRYLAYNYLNMDDLDSAIYNMRITADYLIRTNANIQHKYHVGSSLINLLVRGKKFPEAKKYIDILSDTTSYNYKEDENLRSVFHKALYNYEYATGNFKEAVKYLIDYHRLKDSMEIRIRRVNLGEQNLKLDFQKQKEQFSLQQQMKDFEAQQKLKEQKIFNYALIAIAVFVLIMLGMSVLNIRQRKAAYKAISEQKHEVEKQKALVEVKNKEVMDSIHYAKRIQEALLAHTEFIDANIPANFIYYKPKDIISGDFYWATKQKNLFYLAICDSTGHGVPGAFMSLLNIGFLSEAINEKGLLQPNEILDYVRDRLINSISNENQKDGFDGTLVCFNQKTNKITYASAQNTPILFSNDKLIKLPADKMPVGKSEKTHPFTLHEIPAKQGEVIYFYTDGYADQFGGPNHNGSGKKFKQRNLISLLQNIHHLDFIEQRHILDTEFQNWKGTLEQVDDVCIIGVKL